jgi:CBS domain-containing protein
MPLNPPLTWVPNLEEAIECHPLTLPPVTPLSEAIALISQSHHQVCSLSIESWAENTPKSGKGGCILVVEADRLVGIFTERDVVRLAAQGQLDRSLTLAQVMTHPVITLPHESVQDLFAALFLFRRYRIRHLPVIDEQERLVGIISHESIRQVLRPANLLRFRRVVDVMSQQVVQAPVTTSILELAQLMAAHRVSCIVITQLNEAEVLQPVGIVTERDIVQFQALQLDFGKTQAHSVMSSPLFLLSPEDSLWTAHQEMQKRRVGRLVVSWNWGMELGIVTQTSLLRIFDPMEMYGVIENLQRTLQQLEQNQSAQVLPSSQPILTSDLATATGGDVTTEDIYLSPKPDLKINQAFFQTTLSKVRISLQNLIAQPQRSRQEVDGELQSILDLIEQLAQVIQS